MRAVMDTNVLYAALRSRLGASHQIFLRLRNGGWTAAVSNHLLLEYEEILKRNAEQLGLSIQDIDELLNAICARAEAWVLSPWWTPMLPDPDDEPLAQLAFEAGIIPIVSHNIADLAPVSALGIDLLRPRDFLAILSAQT